MKQVVSTHLLYEPGMRHPVTFSGQDNSFLQIRFVSEKVVRISFCPGNCNGDRWEASESPIALRIQDEPQQKRVMVKTQALSILVDYADGMSLRWIETRTGAIFAEDLKPRAYVYNARGSDVFHYMRRSPSEVYCGLGERTGHLNLHGRRCRLEGFDAMGYDAESTDPLYKHCPFYITLDKNTSIAYGLFYRNMSRTILDLGAEIDALRGPYRFYHAESGPLDYYMFFGPTVETAFDGFAVLMGRPRSLPPRYSLGYLASSMGYAEVENAQERIESFPALCQLHDIPCDGLHLSSGYTVNPDGKRCVFTWNFQRFPDPKRLVNNLRAQGIHVLANVKPWLLDTHPQYARLKALRGFIWDTERDAPAIVMQWSAGAGTCAPASYIDFTSVPGSKFWKQSVKDALMEYGIAGCWNDNNEFTMSDDTHSFAMDLCPDVGVEWCSSKCSLPAGKVGGPIQTLLMAQHSYEAMQEWAPKLRPFVITRSATPWSHQFAAQTWSGDNTTDWKTLKFNIPMGLSAGLSGFPAGYGHDVGGFAGPRPSPELLQRWVQAGVLNPRFCIHSWNSDSTVTEPWMYESAMDNIRLSMHFRMQLIPYLYGLHVEFQRTARPLMRPLLWYFQPDVRTYEQSFEYMLGKHMLVAPVWEEGASSRTVYLPSLSPSPDLKTAAAEPSVWFDFHTGKHYPAEAVATVEAPIDAVCAPVFIPQGGMIPLGKFMHHVGELPDDERIVLLFPPLVAHDSSRTETLLVDDDGLSTLHMQQNEYSELKIWMETQRGSELVKVGLDVQHAGYRPDYCKVWVVIATEERELRRIVVDGVPSPESRVDDKGRNLVAIPLDPSFTAYAQSKP